MSTVFTIFNPADIAGLLLFWETRPMDRNIPVLARNISLTQILFIQMELNAVFCEYCLAESNSPRLGQHSLSSEKQPA